MDAEKAHRAMTANVPRVCVGRFINDKFKIE